MIPEDFISTKKAVAALCVLGCLAVAHPAPLGADERGFAFGLGAEGVGSSLTGLRLGATLTGEVRPFHQVSFGLRGGASFSNVRFGPTHNDPGFVTTFDILAMTRLYLFSPKTVRPVSAELFLEANGGVNIGWGYYLKTRSFEEYGTIGGAAGIRILFNRRLYPETAPAASKASLYIEPFIRGAYPLCFAGGIIIGGRIYAPPKAPAPKPEPAEPAGEPETVDTPAEPEPTPTPAPAPAAVPPDPPAAAVTPTRTADVFLIRFAPNTAVYDGPVLTGAVRDANREALREIAALMRDNPAAQVVIEGATEAVLKLRRNVQAALLTIGERRVFAIIEYLSAAGTDRSRIIVPSRGAAPAPQDERRIEVRVLR